MGIVGLIILIFILPIWIMLYVALYKCIRLLFKAFNEWED